MRILLVQESDWLERGPLQQHHLMERLQQRGHQIRIIDHEIIWREKPRTSFVSGRLDFLVKGKCCKESELRVIRPRIVKLPLLDYFSIPLSHAAEIARQIGFFRPDVVLGFGLLSTYVAMKICKRYRIPFIYYLIDAYHTLIPEKPLRLFGEVVERRTLSQSDAILVINKQLAELVARLGADPRRVIVLGAGIDTSRFNPKIPRHEIRKKHHINDSDIVLFFMGLLYRFSGLKEVAHSLLDHGDHPHIKLMILGKGDLHGELCRLKINELRDRLILVDWQPYEKIPQYIAASDVCLLPAYSNETMRDIVPIKIYEYMACGKPVITTRLSGIIREFGKGNGILYAESPDQVVNMALSLARDRAEMRRLGARAFNYVKEYNWENTVVRFEKVLEETCSKYNSK
jgi:glycosyltransferase involved in cell wall biosynthesis